MPNKTVVVTGASSGIGKATAETFLQNGHDVVAIGRNRDQLEQLSQTASSNNCRLDVQIADLSDVKQVESVSVTLTEQHEHIDVLVNAAGIIGNGTIENTSLQDWDSMLNINLRSVYYLMHCLTPALKKSKGNIVNVSSVTGTRAFPNVLAYCVSKAGIDQLTKCAALELAPFGVRVNAVNPGVVITNLHRRGGMAEEAYEKFLEHSKTTHPLGRGGRPEEVANLIYFLASDKASWITGITYAIDGGRAETCAR